MFRRFHLERRCDVHIQYSVGDLKSFNEVTVATSLRFIKIWKDLNENAAEIVRSFCFGVRYRSDGRTSISGDDDSL